MKTSKSSNFKSFKINLQETQNEAGTSKVINSTLNENVDELLDIDSNVSATLLKEKALSVSPNKHFYPSSAKKAVPHFADCEPISNTAFAAEFQERLLNREENARAEL